MFIVFCRNWAYEEIDIGYLPFLQIPEDSILRKGVFDPKVAFDMDGMGINGIYQQRSHAEEHLKIEQEWRDKDTLWIEEIKIPESVTIKIPFKKD